MVRLANTSFSCPSANQRPAIEEPWLQPQNMLSLRIPDQKLCKAWISLPTEDKHCGAPPGRVQVLIHAGLQPKDWCFAMKCTCAGRIKFKNQRPQAECDRQLHNIIFPIDFRGGSAGRSTDIEMDLCHIPSSLSYEIKESYIVTASTHLVSDSSSREI